MKFKKLLSTMLALVCFISTVGTGFVGEVEAFNNRVAWVNTWIRGITWTGNVPELTAAGLYGGIMEGVVVSLSNLTGNQNIETRIFSSGIEQWHPWVSNNQIAAVQQLGAQHIRAIQVRLVNLPGWSIYYRVHMQTGGWTQWQANGTTAGNTSTGTVNAIQIYVVQNPQELRFIQLYHDQTTLNARPRIDAEFNIDYILAAAAIHERFQVLVIPSAPSTLTALLNGGASPAGTCNRANSLVCLEPQPPTAQNCLFYNNNCNGNHHKNDERLLDSLKTAPLNPSTYRMGVVNHIFCYWEPNPNNPSIGIHRDTSLGLADAPGRASVVNYRAGSNFRLVIQHELFHNLAGDIPLVHCDGTIDCVMVGFVGGTNGAKLNEWCPTHANQIINRRDAVPPLL